MDQALAAFTQAGFLKRLLASLFKQVNRISELVRILETISSPTPPNVCYTKHKNCRTLLCRRRLGNKINSENAMFHEVQWVSLCKNLQSKVYWETLIRKKYKILHILILLSKGPFVLGHLLHRCCMGYNLENGSLVLLFISKCFCHGTVFCVCYTKFSRSFYLFIEILWKPNQEVNS